VEPPNPGREFLGTSPVVSSAKQMANAAGAPRQIGDNDPDNKAVCEPQAQKLRHDR